jgi:hypothetical protein
MALETVDRFSLFNGTAKIGCPVRVLLKKRRQQHSAEFSLWDTRQPADETI